MATVTSGQMSYILDEVTSAVAINRFVQLGNQMSLLYSMRTSNRSRERVTSVSGLGKFQSKNEGQSGTQDAPIQQFQKDFNHTPFSLETHVAREIIDDENWGWFESLGMQMGNSANRTMEYLAFGLFNDMFTGLTYKSEDALSICNSAHVNVDSGNSQDNSGTTALGVTGLNTARVAMRNFTDYRGEQIGCTPDTLLVPNNLEQTAWELVRSNLRPGSANNDANFYNGLFNLIVSSYLTDTNDWFLIDSAAASMNLLWYQRSGLEVYGSGDLFLGRRSVGAYFRQSHGAVDWRWVYGMSVT